MSVHAISLALKLRGVSASEKLVLLVLANYADEKNRSFPSHRRLSEETGLTDRTVLTVMKALEARGLLSREERRRPDGSRATDVITLNWGGEMISPRGENDRKGGGETVSPRGEMVSPLTTFEPSDTRKKEEPILAARAPTSRATKRCPPSFLPSEGDLASGAAEGFSPGEIERELSKFRDHTFGTARSDWSATFRNWLRTAAERRPRNDRPDPAAAKRTAREDNYGRSYAAAMAVAGARTNG